jgi:hypothetical protein
MIETLRLACRKHPHAARGGVSMTEVMIAIVVIGAVISPIFFLFSRGTAGTVQTRDELIAHAHAQDLLDYAQSLEFANPFLAPGPEREIAAIPLVSAGGAGLPLEMEPRYKRMLTVKPVSVSGVPTSYKVLTAEVSWNTGTQNRSAILTALMSDGK